MTAEEKAAWYARWALLPTLPPLYLWSRFLGQDVVSLSDLAQVTGVALMTGNPVAIPAVLFVAVMVVAPTIGFGFLGRALWLTFKKKYTTAAE